MIDTRKPSTEAGQLQLQNTSRPDGSFVTERGVLLIPGQDPALLPGWQLLAS